VAHGHGNCFDTASKTINLLGPAGSFAYTASKLCHPGHCNVFRRWQGHYKLPMAFDNSERKPQPAPTLHIPTARRLYLPKLVIFDAGGCQTNGKCATPKNWQCNGIIGAYRAGLRSRWFFE